ncbi:hypothetical protein K504DRAFT_501478 [Pleomassaria siparia CBS 279.74]|uniref:F-box domain-containing protein n=1 Tax=Pleomassaria siparia CBS 279.74 TaxID=1314801 RepID=A0A6G1KBK6_9PLEO|nr:hypothetical protein K504DRAFT_501478 [Pleomassaria siparia CBS 279.74]
MSSAFATSTANNLEVVLVVIYYRRIRHFQTVGHSSDGRWNPVTELRRKSDTHAPHSTEARLAQNRHISYSEALKSIYDRREAFSNANPFSARVIGQGTAFTYRQGILCVLDANTIRISNVHASSGSHEIEISSLITSIAESSSRSSSSPTTSYPAISLLYYSDGILAVHCECKGRLNHGRVFAISTALGIHQSKRVIREIHLESSYKLFVRHTPDYLYYGTFTATGSHGHREWEIRGVSLSSKHPLPACLIPLQLEKFFGTDMGSTVAFHIHNGYFHAVSNQTSFDVEELDWTSFYHCIRFPLALPVKQELKSNARVYRRQHAEGPIHDSWTDLSIQIDEVTDNPVIVESRREWQNGSSHQLRTFYMTPFNPIPDSSSGTTTPSGVRTAPALPMDDPLSELVDSSNCPNYAPKKLRETWEFHAEFQPDGENDRSFILARTKFRAYNLSCSSFLDLVEDEKCCTNSTTGPCLRIRIGSRRVAPQDWTPINLSSGPSSLSSSSTKAKLANALSVVENSTVYRHSKIKMWPPPASKCACSKRLHGIINPELPCSTDGRNKIVAGIVDERSLVYMVRTAKAYGKAEEEAPGLIIVVNFSRNVLSTAAGRSGIEGHEKVDSSIMDIDEADDVEKEKSWQWSTACQKGQCR